MSLASNFPAGRIDGKRGTDVGLIVSHFKFQPNISSCYPNCIYNILDDLSRAHNSSAIRLAEAKINQICQNRPFLGPKLEVVVPNLNDQIGKWGYTAQENFRTSYSRMTSVLSDLECSYPMIGLSYGYLLERGAVAPLNKSMEPPDHVVIVLSSDASETVIYDPYEGLSRRMQLQSQQQGLPRGAFMMVTPRLLEHWQQALFPSWMFWVRRKTMLSPSKSTILSRLDSYSKPKKEIA